jgi:hypothetical protein
MFRLAILVVMRTLRSPGYCPALQGTFENGKEVSLFRADSDTSRDVVRLIFSSKQLTSVLVSCKGGQLSRYKDVAKLRQKAAIDGVWKIANGASTIDPGDCSEKEKAMKPDPKKWPTKE